MTRLELVENLGTIARSGTKSFIEKLKESSKDINQIGQFGVGFYSSFLAADYVTVYTKNNNDKEYIWESNSNKSYTIRENPEPSLLRGTRIVLKIKDDQTTFLKVNTVKEIIKKYTQFINFPIELLETKTIELDAEDDDMDDDADSEKKEKTDNDEPSIEELDEEDEETESATKPSKKIKKNVDEWCVINDIKPIWTKKPDDVSEEEYKSFYKSISNDQNEPISYKHFKTEGQLEITSILYIPDNNGMNMFQQQKEQEGNDIQLYVRKVFIKKNCDGLLPPWLNFMKGMVDSNDIPLNVSRELLQQNKIIKTISKQLVKKSLELFNDLTEDEEKYKKFYNLYSKILKLGIHGDEMNRDKLTKLLRYYSINNEDTYISLDTYIENMKEGQDSIYYITGQSRESIANSPFIEARRQRGEDVLYFTEPIDEYMVSVLTTYNGKKLVDLCKEGLLLDEELIKKRSEENKDFIEFFKTKLGSKINDVKVTDRLTSVPCMLSSAQFGWTANMERIIKAQAVRNDSMDQFMGSRKILELNLDHRIIKMIHRRYKEDKEATELVDILNLLYNTALLNSGFQLSTPTEYANKINNLIEVGFCNEDDETPDCLDSLEPCKDKLAGNEVNEVNAVDEEDELEEDELEEVD